MRRGIDPHEKKDAAPRSSAKAMGLGPCGPAQRPTHLQGRIREPVMPAPSRASSRMPGWIIQVLTAIAITCLDGWAATCPAPARPARPTGSSARRPSPPAATAARSLCRWLVHCIQEFIDQFFLPRRVRRIFYWCRIFRPSKRHIEHPPQCLHDGHQEGVGGIAQPVGEGGGYGRHDQHRRGIVQEGRRCRRTVPDAAISRRARRRPG